MSDVQLLWRGHDGRTWDWLSGEQGVLAGRGVSGLLFPDFEQVMADAQTGGRWQGMRARARKLDVKLQIGDNIASLVPPVFEPEHPFYPNLGASLARDTYRRGGRWRELDRNVRLSLLPTKPGVLSCITPEGKRTITLVVSSVTDTMQTWSDLRGFHEYDVEFLSESPYWSGEDVTFSLSVTTESEKNYYGGGKGTKGAPFYLSDGMQLTGQPILNPGDVEAWPVWELTGPGKFIVSVGQYATATKLLVEGETLIIDTAQRRVTDPSGVTAWARLESRSFAPIPAGESSDVSVKAVDTGSGAAALMRFTPQFMGAY